MAKYYSSRLRKYKCFAELVLSDRTVQKCEIDEYLNAGAALQDAWELAMDIFCYHPAVPGDTEKDFDKYMRYWVEDLKTGATYGKI